jgi:nucleotide-binding universal stress UspA family protein
MFKHIPIPTDGSPIANKAVKAGVHIQLAKELGARVTGYYAIEPITQHVYGEGYRKPRRAVVEFGDEARRAAQGRSETVGPSAH